MVDKGTALGIAFGIPGMMWPSESDWMYHAFSKSRRHLEVGSYCGKSAWVTAAGMEDAPSRKITLIEDFRFPLVTQRWTERVLMATQDVIKNMAGVEANLLRMSSVDAFRMVQQQGITFDSVYIDGSHDYDSVKQDIEMWSTLVRPGGIIAGHDYWPAHGGVMDAVNYTGPFSVVPQTRIWHRIKG